MKSLVLDGNGFSGWFSGSQLVDKLLAEGHLDIFCAKKELCWEPTISLESGIARTWEFVQRVTA